MAKLNIPLLKRLRTRLLRMKHPEHFDMASYADKTSCGTSMCIAGHALDLQGYKVRFDLVDSEGDQPVYTEEFYSPTGVEVNPHDAAMGELGFSPAQANSLFFDDSLRTPKQAAERIQRIIETGEV